MTPFEITIASEPQGGAQMTLTVDADHWIDAWQRGLAELGEPADPRDVDCEVAQGEIRLRMRSTGRRLVIRATHPAGAVASIAAPPPALPRPRRAVPRGPEDFTAIDLASVTPEWADRLAPDAPAHDCRRRAPARLAPRWRLTTDDGRPRVDTGDRFRLIPRVGRLGDTREEVAARTAELLWRHIPCAGAQVLLTERHGRGLRVQASLGAPGATVIGAQVASDQTCLALATRSSMRMDLQGGDARLAYQVTLRQRVTVGVRSLLGVPLGAPGQRGGLVGVLLLLDSPRPGGFTGGELTAVRYLATVAQARLEAL